MMIVDLRYLGSKGSNEPYKFSFNLREDKDVKKEIQSNRIIKLSFI